jgi:chitodextrinase
MFNDMGWTVADACGATPITGLTATNNSPTVLGATTYLTATISGGSNVSYEWAFGDGNGDTGAEVSHQYAATGAYTAMVTATNSVGQASTSTFVQVVDAAISGLAAENDGPTTLGSSTHLTATIGGGSNVTYEWTFGDGNGDTGAEVSHQYAAIGSYTAVVTATNSVGQESTSTLVKVVDTAISGLAAENDGPTTLGSSTYFTATISGGSNVTYEWAFGDGESGIGAEVSHQYAAAGTYTATVTASNSVSLVTTKTVVQVKTGAFSIYFPVILKP